MIAKQDISVKVDSIGRYHQDGNWLKIKKGEPVPFGLIEYLSNRNPELLEGERLNVDVNVIESPPQKPKVIKKATPLKKKR